MTATATAESPSVAAPPVARAVVTLLPTGWLRFDNARRVALNSAGK